MPEKHTFLSRLALFPLAATIFLIVAVAAFILFPRSSKNCPIPDSSNWQTGDIFFSSGTSWKSDVVRLFGGCGDNETSHCGFVMMQNGKAMLVHMSTDRDEISMESILEYMMQNEASSVRAMRLTDAPDTTALRRNLERLLAERKRFDSSFNHRKDDRYYCSELVVKELRKVGQHSLDSLLNSSVIYPQDIETSGALIPVPDNN